MRLAVKFVYAVRCIQKYDNWAKMIMARAKKQTPTQVILRNGIHFEAPGGFVWLGYVDEIFFTHTHTPARLQPERDDIVVDIGAHVGVFTVFAASRTQNTVYAFEPFPSNFEILKRNISVNKLSNVVLYRSAVADKVGSAELLLSPRANTRHMLSDPVLLDQLEKYQTSAEHLQFESIMPGKLEESLEVPTTTLQEIMDCNNIEQIGFLKMNCEGSEGLILTSTPKSYLKRIRKIIVEFHDHLSKINHDDIRKLLEETGFITYLKWDGKSPLGSLYAWRD
jgi:FkbM family methyltransferase